MFNKRELKRIIVALERSKLYHEQSSHIGYYNNHSEVKTTHRALTEELDTLLKKCQDEFAKE